MEFEGRSRIRAHLDLAPLIDVVFLLLVFFMLTSTFLVPESMDLQLPTAETSQPNLPEGIVVTLTKTGEVAINGEIVHWDNVRTTLERLMQERPQAPVVLRSDARTEVQQLLRLMDEVRLAGGTDIALATLPPGDPVVGTEQ